MSTWACTPRSRSRALFFAAALALLLVFVYSVPAFANDRIVNGNAGCSDTTGSPSYCHIQAAIDAATAGDIIKVYPGSYSETAANRLLWNNTGPYQFGLFINKALTIQGVDAGGAPITDANSAAALVTTNATNNFGPSSVWVEGDGVTITGLVIGANSAGENKTFEVLGDNFTLKYSRIAVPGGGSVYLNDERFDAVNNVSHLKSYTIEANRFEQGASLDITNGAGYSGPVSGRQVKNNKFIYGAADSWAAVSFSGSGTGVAWFVHSVGGAVITGNEFSGGQQYIRARGTYDNTQFDWASYWSSNTFDHGAVTLVGGSSGFDVRTYSYTSGSYQFNDVRRIGGLIGPEIATAQPGDTVQLTKGLYVENITVDKHVKLLGVGSGSDPAVNTVLRLPNNVPPIESTVTISGSGASDADPLLLKSLRVEPMGEVGISLGVVGNWNLVQNVSYIRFEDVQVVGTPVGQNHIENERCLDLELNKSVAHLTVVNSSFSQCDHGWYFNKNNGGIFTPNTAQYITVYNSSFINNGFKGIYAELLSDAVFDNVVVTGNGKYAYWNGDFNAGVDVNLKAGVYQNLVFRNMTVTDNGIGAKHGAGLLVKARDDGATYGANPATLTNVSIEGGVFSDNERGIVIGEPGKNNNGPTNVQIHNATITGNVKTYGPSDGSVYGGLVNQSKSAVNAEYNWWGSASGPSGDGSGSGDAARNASTGSLDFTPWLGYAPPLALYVPGDPIDLRTGATSFTLPVMVNDGDFSSTAFSLDYDTACLSINPTDANGDDVVDAVTGIPGGFVGTVKLDTADADGELDVALWDPTAPLAYMPNGPILKIKFDILGPCQGPDDHTTYVKFSGDPEPSFSDTQGNAVTRTTLDADPLKLDFNQAPAAITLLPGSVDENAPVGTVVGVLSITDPDGDAPVYTLVSGCSGGDADNSKFSINGATVSAGVSFDYEAGVVKTICVQADDGQGGVFKQSLSVSVLPINEPPTDIQLSKHEVAEGAPVGTLVGTLSTTGDPETTQTHSYSLVGGDGSADNGKFSISGNQLKTNAPVDYATQSVYYIRVRSTDNGSPAAYFDKQFVINVLDHSLLSIAETHVVRHSQQIGIPVVFAANGNEPTSASFTVSYNAACLAYVSTTGGAGSASAGAVTVNTNGPFVDGTLVTITFSANPACQSGTSVPLNFTAASLMDGTNPLPVDTDNGKVLVISNSDRGDCNNDGRVNAGDFSAIVLETFDADEPWWLNAPQSTFPGSPRGCDANASEYIDVADVVCTVLVVFGNSSCTGGSLLAAGATQPAVLALNPAVEGKAVDVPVALTAKGAAIAGAAFTITYDPQQMVFDESDGDGDGLPDAVTFATGKDLKRSVSVDAVNGRIKVAVYGVSLPLPTIADGLLATVRLQARGDQPLASLGVADAALGNAAGSNTPVEVEVNGVSASRWLYLPAISN